MYVHTTRKDQDDCIIEIYMSSLFNYAFLKYYTVTCEISDFIVLIFYKYFYIFILVQCLCYVKFLVRV